MNLADFMTISLEAGQVSTQNLSKKVDFYDIMDFAILKEEEAYDSLMELCDKIESNDAKDALHRLALEELEHIKVLRKLLEEGPNHFKVTDIEIGKYQDNEYKDSLPLNASVKDVLEYTITKEKDSYLFYKDMARAYKNKETKDTLINLARLEKAHQARLEKIYHKYFLAI